MQKKIGILVVALLFLCGAGYWYHTEQQTKAFKETSTAIYNEYKVLIDDGNKLVDNSKGRSFENLFRELGDIKQKNQAIKMKVAAMVPPTDDAKKLHAQLLKTITDHDESLTNIITLYENQRTIQMRSFNKNSTEYKEAIKTAKANMEKQKEAATMSREDRKILQAMLGVPVDQDPPEATAQK